MQHNQIVAFLYFVLTIHHNDYRIITLLGEVYKKNLKFIFFNIFLIWCFLTRLVALKNQRAQ